MLISVMTRDSVYYEVELELPNPMVKYYFEVKTETTLYSYGDTAGVKDQQEVEIIPFVFDWVPAESIHNAGMGKGSRILPNLPRKVL